MSGLLSAVLLGLAGLVGLIGSWRQRAARGSRWLLLALLLQAALIAVLWRLFYPPSVELPTATLLVLTADHGLDGATPLAQDEALQSLPADVRAEIAHAGRVIALPEAGALPAALVSPGTTVPDLATALRQTPAARLIVLGQGLPARDRDLARTLPLRHLPAAPARGIVELRLPPQPRPGAWWSLHGRVQPVSQGWQLRLFDPAGAEQARLEPAADGRFELTARAPIVGRHLYRLELLDGPEQVIERISVPIEIESAPPLRLALHTAAPNPESKYLRRWALDAGLALDSRQPLRPGLTLSSGAASTTPRNRAEDWAQTDLLIIEDRVWRSWRPTERAAARAAVEAGMGLLLRLTEAPDTTTTALYAELGFRVGSADLPLSVQLPPRPGGGGCRPVEPSSSAALTADTDQPAGCAAAAMIELTRRPLEVSAAQSTPLLRNADGNPLGLWRPLAAGRVGLLWLSDSYRLALANEPAEHADHWSNWVGTLARAQGLAVLAIDALPAQLWVDERATLCGPWRSVLDPTGKVTSLLPDPQAANCSGWWPTQVGWHRLTRPADSTATSSATASTGPGTLTTNPEPGASTDTDLAERWVYVRGSDDGVALYRQQTQDWMSAHRSVEPIDKSNPQAVDAGEPASSTIRTQELLPTSSRWFWWSSFWLLASALWWLERPRAGQRSK